MYSQAVFLKKMSDDFVAYEYDHCLFVITCVVEYTLYVLHLIQSCD